ncbi:MAG: hypothetical protein QOC65_1553 [Sphingomonadales bacterium]|nr:hypothetical protein [Sphingomonadales bacterium]
MADTFAGMANRFSGVIAAVAAAAAASPADARPICEADPPTGASPIMSRPMALPRTRRATGARIAIPFAPPLGETAHYRLRSISGERSRPRISEIDFSLRFERAPGGYRMTIVRTANDEQRAAGPAAAVAFVERPMIFRLDPGGRVVAMEGEEAFWAALAAVLPEPSERTAPDASDLRHLLLRLSLLRDDPAEERTPTLAAFAAPVLGHARATVVPRDARPGLQTVPTMSGSTMVHVSRYATRVARGRLFVAVESSPPAMQLETLLQSSLPPDRGSDLALLASSHRYEAEVSLATGLARRAFTEIRADVDWNGRCRQLIDSHEVTLIGRRASRR